MTEMKGFLRILVRALASLLFIHRIQLKNLARSAVEDPALKLTRPEGTSSCTRDPPNLGRSLLKIQLLLPGRLIFPHRAPFTADGVAQQTSWICCLFYQRSAFS